MNMFSGKRYFNDIVWARPYNNSTLPGTGIISNNILKYKEHSYGKVKGKGVFFAMTIFSVSNLWHQEAWN